MTSSVRTALLLVVLGGCTSRPLEKTQIRSPTGASPETLVRTDLNQPADRIAALVAVENWRDPAEFDKVLAGLNDPDEVVRKAAARRAERLVGKAIPYHSFWPPERREAAINAYRRLTALAEQNGKDYLIDLVPVLLDRIETANPAERQQTIDDTVLLTGFTVGLKAEDQPSLRQARVGMYRKIWAMWNQPGNNVLQRKRGLATNR